MAFLRDGRFWGGVLTGYLLVVFMPALSVRGKVGGGAGARIG